MVNEEGYPHEGFLDFAENRFDSGTGTIRVRGVFENPRPKVGNRPFMPGLFARVRVRIGQPYKALMIAERALGSDQGQKYVLVVNAKNEVEYRRVTVGRLEGQLREIREGLKGDEHVIVNGQLRVRPGDTVAPKLVAMETWTGDAPAETTPAEATAAATSDKPHP